MGRKTHTQDRQARRALPHLALLLLLSLPVPGASAGEYILGQPVSVQALRLDVSISPEDHELVARADLALRAEREPVTAFDVWLNQAFRVEQIRPARGIRFRWERERGAPHFAPTTRALRFDLPHPLRRGEVFRLILFYRGRIPGVVNGVNQVRPDLVELALYSGWFPRVVGAGDFDVDLRVDLPAGMEVVSFAEPVRVERGKRRTRTHFAMRSRSEDVVLVAAPGLRAVRREHDGVRGTLHFADLPEAEAAAALDAVLWFERFYRRDLGLPPAVGEVVVVASPRPGWSYVRAPLLVVSRTALAAGLDPQTGAGRLTQQGLAHEVGHLWWRLADSYSYDDWLNEGLAELCALRALERRSGAGAGRELVGDYLSRIRGIAHPYPIGVTLRSDRAAEPLFYAKGPMVLRLLSWLMGEERFLAALREYYLAFRDAPRAAADTVAFREIAERHHGGDLAWFFQTWVYDAVLPRIELDHETHESTGGGWIVDGVARQIGGEPIRLPLEVEARGEHGESATLAVALEGSETPFSFELAFRPATLVLDPARLVPRREEEPADLDQATPAEVVLLLRMARQREDDGEPAESERLYEAALQAAPDNFYALYGKGRVAARGGRLELALAHHARAELTRQGHPRMWGWNLVRIGELRLRLGDRAGAVDAFRRALTEADFDGSHQAADRALSVSGPEAPPG